MYGFGKTPHPACPLTIADYARGVRELLSDISAEDVVLVGHSFGGRVAMRIAACDPRVKGVVLIDSAGIIPRRGPFYYLKVWSYKTAKKLRFRKLPKGSADYAALTGAMKRTFVNVVNESSENDASAIAVPTLLLWGRSDRDTPLYMCKKLKKLIRDSESIVMAGGHFAYLAHTDTVCRIVRAFRERV